MSTEVVLSKQDLRAVTAFAAACAETVLGIFEADRPDDPRPRDAIGAAWVKAAKDAHTAPAREAARAAMAAAGAAYLHPLAKATQVKHILGAGAHAARAAELVADGDATDHIGRTVRRATPVVVDVLRRFPAAPDGGGRVGELIRVLDADLRSLTRT